MGATGEARKVVADFIEFANNISGLDNEAEYYYWMTEAILRAADEINRIESQEEEQ